MVYSSNYDIDLSKYIYSHIKCQYLIKFKMWLHNTIQNTITKIDNLDYIHLKEHILKIRLTVLRPPTYKILTVLHNKSFNLKLQSIRLWTSLSIEGA